MTHVYTGTKVRDNCKNRNPKIEVGRPCHKYA